MGEQRYHLCSFEMKVQPSRYFQSLSSMPDGFVGRLSGFPILQSSQSIVKETMGYRMKSLRFHLQITLHSSEHLGKVLIHSEST